MYNSQYYTCEQIDQRLLQGYLDDYNTQTGQSLTKAQFLTKLGNIFSKEGVIDNIATQVGYYECDTAAGTAAKAITVANYALFAGGSMKVKFANKNTANNATLNINSQGAKALYYQGERVSATNSWDAEEVVEIYYDGTSYYANNVKGGSGSGVYDVSKEHPTSGPNGDGKFTIEYILNLSNVNELIPINERYPGMSIQFVSTYDNKYVQYRYMGTAVTGSPNPFLDTANWQGVDDEPVAGSKNLLESGGADKNAFGIDVLKTTTITEDYIISSSTGEPTTSQFTQGYACTDYIPVKYGDIIRLAFVRGLNLCGGCTYDENHNKIGVIWGTDDGSIPSGDVNVKGFQFTVLNKEISYIRYNLVTDAIFPRDMQYISILGNTLLNDVLKAQDDINVSALKQSTPGGIISNVIKRGYYNSSLAVLKSDVAYIIIEIDLSYVNSSIAYECSLDKRNAGLPVIVGMKGGNVVASLVSNSSGSESIDATLQKSTLVSAGYDAVGISTMATWTITVDGLTICNNNTPLSHPSDFSYFIEDSYLPETARHKNNKFIKSNLGEADGNGYNVLKTSGLDGITDFITATVYLSGTIPVGLLMNSDDEVVDYIYKNDPNVNGYQYILIDLGKYNGDVSYILWNTYGLTIYFPFYEVKVLKKTLGYNKEIEAQEKDSNFLSENINERINISPYYQDGFVKADGTFGSATGYSVFRTHGLKGKRGTISVDMFLAGTVRQAVLLDENDVVVDTFPANDGTQKWNNITIDLDVYDGTVDSVLFNTYDVTNPEHAPKTYQWYLVTPKKVDVQKVYTVSTASELVEAILDSENATIYINEGTYDIFDEYTPTANSRGLYLQDNCKLIGLGNKENVIINGSLSDETNPSIIDMNSVINVVKNCEIKNLTITGTNVRYCVHSDNGEVDDNEGKNTTIVVEDCAFIHNGINVETTNNGPCAWGMGVWSGCKRIFRNCYFEGNNAPGWATHNQLNQAEPSYVLLENCQFVNRNRDVSFQTGDFKKERCISIGSVGNNLGDIIEIRNCSGNAYFWHIQNGFAGGTNIGLDYVIKGGGNILLPVRFYLTSGAAYDSDYQKYAHTEFADEGAYYISKGNIASGDIVKPNAVVKVEKTTNFAGAIGLCINDAISGNKIWVISKGYVPVSSLNSNLTSNVGDTVSYSGGVWSNSNSGNVFTVKRKGFIFVDFTR